MTTIKSATTETFFFLLSLSFLAAVFTLFFHSFWDWCVKYFLWHPNIICTSESHVFLYIEPKIIIILGVLSKCHFYVPIFCVKYIHYELFVLYVWKAVDSKLFIIFFFQAETLLSSCDKTVFFEKLKVTSYVLSSLSHNIILKIAEYYMTI